jgi:hypothetical protein
VLNELAKNYRAPSISMIENCGSDFPGIKDGEADFVFSFDVFVHLELNLIDFSLISGGCSSLLRMLSFSIPIRRGRWRRITTGFRGIRPIKCWPSSESMDIQSKTIASGLFRGMAQPLHHWPQDHHPQRKAGDNGADDTCTAMPAAGRRNHIVVCYRWNASIVARATEQ